MTFQFLVRRSGSATRAFDTDVLAWETAVIANGGTVSLARRIIVDQFVYSEKASGNWALTDDYWGLWGENSAQALTSLKQKRLASAVNTPTFTADRDYTFDGVSNYIDTGFIPNSHGVAYTGNVQRIAAYERTNLNAASYTAGTRVGTSNSVGIICRQSSSITGGLNNTAGAVNFVISPADSRGLKAISRDGGTTALGYDRGVRKTDVTGLTVGSTNKPTVALTVGALNSSGTLISFRAASVGFVTIGGPLSDAQELAQYNAVQAWATSIGAQV